MRPRTQLQIQTVVCGLCLPEQMKLDDVDPNRSTRRRRSRSLHYIVSGNLDSLAEAGAIVEVVTSRVRPSVVSFVLTSSPAAGILMRLSRSPLDQILSPDDRIDVPLYGLMREHDETVGFSGDFDKIMKAANRIHREGGPSTRFIVPLGEETIDRVLPLWHWLEQEGQRFQMTLQSPRSWDAVHRFKIVELLENLSSHPSIALADRLHYRRLQADLIEHRSLAATERIELVGDILLAQKAVAMGWVAPAALSPPFGARVRQFLSQSKLDKAATVALGSARILANRSLPCAGFGRRSKARKSGSNDGILVAGWYGTETAGDKAILAGILRELEPAIGRRAVGVASMLPFYTAQTLMQLGLDRVIEVIPYRSARLEQFIGQAGLVIVGGGPLMDLVEMHDLVGTFQSARRHGAATAICGCGVGPVRWPTTKLAIRELVRLSDRVVLRDQDSMDQLSRLDVDHAQFEVGLDPAISYLNGLPEMRQSRSRNSNLVLGLGIRDWPAKFARGFSKGQYRQHRGALVGVWSELCDRFIEEFDGQIRLVPMHTLHIGSDDRWFQAGIRGRCSHRDRITQFSGSYSAHEIASIIHGCDIFISMRYHSMLFSASLGIPTVVVDYTRGGKVFAFARRHLSFSPLLDIAELDCNHLMDCVRSTNDQYVDIRRRLDEVRMEWPAEARRAGRAAAELIGIQTWPS